jgi:uncharacterized protein (TIGR00255 family)
MIKSMTAYARAEEQAEATSVSIEIRAYNSRYLDVVLRMPQAYLVLEDKIKAVTAETVKRGRVEIRLNTVETAETATEFEIDTSKAIAYHHALTRLKDTLKLEAAIGLEQITGCGDIIKPVSVPKEIDQGWPLIEDCLRRALADLDAMRIKEGDFIGKDITGRIDDISRSLVFIEKESTGLLAHYQSRLKDRIKALTEGIVEIDPVRISQEAALLADRSDITEEIVRAASHLKQFSRIADGEQPAGRKLNFLLQELNREFNTIGSKTEKTAVSHTVVDVKAELEKIREQLQNVE